MAAVAHSPRGYIERPRPSGLADVLEVILDKGIVIDAYVRVSLIGIEILTVDARIVIASVDTYLRFAEAVNRLDLQQSDDSEGLPELMESVTSGGAKSKTQGALEGVKEKLFGDDDDDDDGGGNGKQRQRRTSRASSSGGSSSRGSSSRGSSSRGSSSKASSSRGSSASKASSSRSKSRSGNSK
jgi:gas vesicle structural protein